MATLSLQALHAIFEELQTEAAALKSITETGNRDNAIMELREKLLSAREAASDSHTSILKKVDELENELMRLKDWETERNRYQAQRFEPGVTVYIEKQAVERGEVAKHYCPNCYADRKIRILQGTDREDWSRKISFCPACKTELAYGPIIHRSPMYTQTVDDEYDH